MSAVAPPTATSVQHNDNMGITVNKEELIKFWRSGLEYIAEGVVAYQAARRHARALSAYSNRNDPGARSAAPLAAQATLHNETLDSCVHALVDLSPVSLIQLPSATKPSALDARVAALEDQMKSLLATVKPLEIQLGAVDGKLSRVESTVKSFQAKVTSTITRVDESHKALESRIASLSTRDAANPPPDILTAVGRENGKLAERLKSLEATMRETADKSAKLEARIVEVENLRPKIDDHATKLVITEGKISEIRKNAGEINIKMGSLLVLAPEAKALLSVPAQIKRAEQVVANLNKEYEVIKTQFDSMKATLEVVKKRFDDSNSTNLQLFDVLSTDVAALKPLKQHVNTLVVLPGALGQLRESISELVPLKAHAKELESVAAQAPQLLGLLSHNERINDDITTLRSKVTRFGKDINDAKKETHESVRLLSEQVATLTSTNQPAQVDLAQTQFQMTRIEDGVTTALKESQAISERINGIDAKLKASQVTAEWSQEQIRAMQVQIADLEPLGGQREALMLLSGQTESLMPLAAQFRALSLQVQQLSQANLKQFKAKDATLGRLTGLCSDLSKASEDAKQRLGQVEANVTQLESDASNALERLAELQSSSSAATVQAKQNQQVLQKAQHQITSFAPLNGHVEALTSLANQHTSLTLLVQDFQRFKDGYTRDINSLKDETKKIQSISAEMATLRSHVDDTKKQIAPSIARDQQLRNPPTNLGNFEQKVAKVEKESKKPRKEFRTSSETAEKSPGVDAESSNVQLTEIIEIANNAKKFVDELRPVQSQFANLEKLGSKTDELLSLVETVKRMEDEVLQWTRLSKKYNKRVDDFGDTVHSLDELMTAMTAKATSNQLGLDLLEREFKDWKNTNGEKIKQVEATANELAPLKEHSENLLALIRPMASPASPAQYNSALMTPEARIQQLEKSAKSATKEIINIGAWLTKMDGRLKGLSESVQKNSISLSPVIEHAPAILALLEHPAGPAASIEVANDQPSSDQLETPTQVVSRMNALEENVKALRSFELKAKKDLERLKSQTETLAPVCKDVLQPFVDQAKPLLSLAPLIDHVQNILALADQVSQLQTSVKSLSDRLGAAATLSAVEPGPASQLRSSVMSHQGSQPVSPTSNRTTPVLLFPAEEGSESQSRPKKKRRIEALIESLEEQIDGVRSEVEGVVDEVKQLCQERAKFKKARTGERKQAEAERPPAIQGTEEIAPGARKKLENDLDSVMEALTGLWNGQKGWPERLDLLLGQQWAEVLKLPVENPKGAGSTILELLERLRSEVEVLKLAIEARGSGISPSRSPSVEASHIAWVEKVAGELKDQVTSEQAAFRTQLEDWLNKALKPIKGIYKVLKENEEGLE